MVQIEGMKMNKYTKNVLVRVTTEMQERMQRHKTVKWSEVIRSFLNDYLHDLEKKGK